MITLVVDILIPFLSISILNAILIRAIRQRNRDLETFSDNAVTSGRGSIFNIPMLYTYETRVFALM